MFKFKNRAPEESLNYARVRARIDKLLKDYYQARTSEELPFRLLELLKKLDEDRPESGNHIQVTID